MRKFVIATSAIAISAGALNAEDNFLKHNFLALLKILRAVLSRGLLRAQLRQSLQAGP